MKREQRYSRNTKQNKRYSAKQKYNTPLCDDKMTFEDCELAILRHAVDETDILQKQKIANSDDVKQMIQILENFLIRKKLICYGGTAINNILPKYAQFYDRDIEVPDYDFFSQNALEDAKELSDIFYAAGYLETEAKSGVHKGTYKVFVNYIPMADITQLHSDIYRSIGKETITIAGIRYCPPNYLRMSMYLELSRPAGDVSRWEKVLKRLTLLNKYYPLVPPFDCHTIDFQRDAETLDVSDSQRVYFSVRDSFIEQGVVFFGGYASSLYSKYMDASQQKLIRQIPDFDVLAEDPERSALIIKERLEEIGFKTVQTVHHGSLDDVIPEHIEVRIGKETVAFIFKPIACHNYNTIQIGNKEINVATIDTMLSFYLAFIYADKEYFDSNRILCMAKFLFEVEQKNRLEQRGLLKRFSISCYGKQPTLESIRAEKAEKFKELVHKRNSAEWNAWFFKYSPGATVATTVATTATKGKKREKSVTRKSVVELLDGSMNSRKKTQKKYKSIEKQENQENQTDNREPKSKSRNILQKILGIGM